MSLAYYKEENKDMQKNEYDVIIIGAGVEGCMIARELSRYKLRILLIEKNGDVATGTTKANTGIVHAGYNAAVGSNKASMNVRGNALFDTIASELNVPFERIGDYVVALTDEDIPKIETLLDKGKKNGVPGIEILSKEEMLRREPNLNPNLKLALYAPTGGMVDPIGLSIAAAENAIDNGVEIKLLTEVKNLLKKGKRIVGVETNRGNFYGKWIINSAGLYSDVIMKWAGIESDFKITPRKGEYFIFDPSYKPIHSILFPTPTPTTKGILVTITTYGNIGIGPNDEETEDKEDKSTTYPGLKEVMDGGKRLVPSLNMKYIIKEFAGLRARGNAGLMHDRYSSMIPRDFIMEVPDDVVEGFVNLAGIESPGLAASPGIAEWVVNALKEHGLKMEKKKDFNPIRTPIPSFASLSREEQARLIEKDPRFGRIVCRCENVTEGEIVRAIHAPLPALSYDALKRRLHIGMGRCQGGFDTPRTIEILSRELGIPPVKVTKNGDDSFFLKRETKSVEAKK